jgi:hypothetical protein
MRGDLQELGMALNVVSADAHVPEVKRYIRTVKERSRCVYNTVPFKRMPTTMVVEMVCASVFWLNMFPPTDEVSDTLSPTGLIVGLKLDYKKHCQIEFSSYVQTHEEHDSSMLTQTTGAIALRPTGNTQGGYYFLSLSSGRRLTRNRWIDLPMPQEGIDRVHVLTRRSNANWDLTFAWRNGTIIDDNDDDDDDDSDWKPNSDDTDSDWEPDSDSESVSTQGDDDAHPVDGDDDTPPDDIDLPLAGVDDAEKMQKQKTTMTTSKTKTTKMKSKPKLKKMRKKTKLKSTRRTATTNLKRYPRVNPTSKTTRTQEWRKLQEWTTIHRWWRPSRRTWTSDTGKERAATTCNQGETRIRNT